MRFQSFSPKQKRVLSWWCPSSADRDREGILCDGAVRSGKTLCMGLSFFCWAMASFDGQRFGVCGATRASVERNILFETVPALEELGFDITWQKVKGQLSVRFGGHENVFFLYGGRNEGSAGLIQGVTLAGVLLDEAAIMPRSFVEQACARCSVKGAKVWLNCNPEGPEHWLYREWVCKAEEKKLLHLRFTMEDNPVLDERTRERYARMFSGTFYRRFVLGEWVAAEGLVYDFFCAEMMAQPPDAGITRWRISCDYGTVNPASFGLWGEKDGVWYRVKEYYYDSRAEGRQKTDREYVEDLLALAGKRRVECVIVDPSAASFMEALRQTGLQVEKADNRVVTGIRVTAEKLKNGDLVICKGCDAALREFQLYCWDQKSGEDKVVKSHDHAMDEIRYFAMSLEKRDEPLAAVCVERRSQGGYDEIF